MEPCGPRYGHFELAAALPLQNPPLKKTPNSKMSPKEKIKGIQIW
jgi:hypothetical protein